MLDLTLSDEVGDPLYLILFKIDSIGLGLYKHLANLFKIKTDGYVIYIYI